MQTKKRSFLLRTALLVVSAVAALLSLFAGRFQFDPTANYYLRGSLLPVLSLVFALCGVALAAVPIFLKGKEEPVAPCSIAAIFPALGSGAAGIIFLRTASSLCAESKNLALVSGVLLFVSAAYFLLSAIFGGKRAVGLQALFSFAPVLAMASVTFYYYFDKSIEMNSPLKTALQVGLLCAMPLFLADTRRLLGRPLPKLLTALRDAFLPLSGLSWLLFSQNSNRPDYLVGAILIVSIEAYFLLCLIPARDHI